MIVAMVIIFAVAAMVLTLGRSMRGEASIAANAAAAREAAITQRGAEQYVLALLAETSDDTIPLELLGEEYFVDVRIGNGRFWIVRPDYNDPTLPAFGLVDESAKIDLNTVNYGDLLRLPGMTEQLAASIIDWRDEDDDITEGVGAESQTYLGRSPAHEAKNAPFENVEELLLVEGMTPELLYGPETQPPLGITGGLLGDTGGLFAVEQYQRRGFFDLFTVWSQAPTTAPDGRVRLDVDGDEQPLRDLVTEIIGGSRADEINSRLDDEDNIFEFAMDADITSDELRQLEPYLMAGDPQQGIRGRVNVNSAPREVLLTADDDLADDQVELILTARPAATVQYPGTMAWLLDTAPDGAEEIGERIVARGSFFSADIVALSGNGRGFRRVRIAVDASDSAAPQIVYRRDLTDRGWPLDPQLLQDIRTGQLP